MSQYEILSSGYLVKEGGRGHGSKNKKTRYFELTDLFMYYYSTEPKEEGKKKSQISENLKGILYLPGCGVKDNPHKTNSFIVETKDKEYIMYCVDQLADDANKVLDNWRNCLEFVISRAKTMEDLPFLSGWLSKKSLKDKSYNKVYCYIRGNHLTFHSDQPSKENDVLKMKGWIDLFAVSSIVTEAEDLKEFGFKLITNDGKVHSFNAKDIDEKKKWVDAVTTQIEKLKEKRFTTSLGIETEKVKRVGRFTRTVVGGKSTANVVALTDDNLRFFPSDRNTEDIQNNVNKELITLTPLYMASALTDGKILTVTNVRGVVTNLYPLDANENLGEWVDLITKNATDCAKRIVKQGGSMRVPVDIVVDDQTEDFAVMTLASKCVSIDIFKDRSHLDVKHDEFKSAVVTYEKNYVTFTHSGIHNIRSKNNAGLAIAISAVMEAIRIKKKTKGAKKRTASSAKKARASSKSVAKKGAVKKAKKKLTEGDSSKLRALFKQYDTDNSGTIDKIELRAVIEGAMKVKISEKLIQKYLEVEFHKSDTDGNGSLDYEEFAALYQRLYMDPELPIVVSIEDLGHQAPTQLETGENAPKVEKRIVTITADQKAEALAKFDKYDKDGSGAIDKDELFLLLKATVGKNMGEKILQRFVDSQFQLADVDGSGEIDKGEFIDLYVKLYFTEKTGLPMFGIPAAGSAPVRANSVSAQAAAQLPPPLVDAAALPPPLTN